MRDRLRLIWNLVQGSLWFVPLVMGAVAVALAILLLNLDAGLISEAGEYWLLYTGSAENARELMSALLSGMITMTSLVVSITMVVLTLAAGQIGPRLIRSFIQDRTTQAVLGLFLADILYLLMVFRTIDGPPDGAAGGVPHLAVSTGTGLTVLCLLVLLVYIHKLARSIIYDTVVRNVTVELRETVARLMPDRDPATMAEDAAGATPAEAGDVVRLERDGYVQAIGTEELVDLARDCGLTIRLLAAPGDFALAAAPAATVHPAGALTKHRAAAIRKAILTGAERTPDQDIGFGIRQLVEIATRALSPGLNDVFTAVAVIDNLSAALADILGRAPAPAILRDAAGHARVLRTVPEHAALVGQAFDQIRHAGGGNPAILIRLADAIARLAPIAAGGPARAALRDQLEAIRAAGEQNLAVPRDRDALRRHADAAMRAIEDSTSAGQP